MRKFGIFIILFSFILIFASLFISVTEGRFVFEKTINFPEIYSKNTLSPLHFEKGKYHFVFKIDVEEGKFDSNYAIDLKNQSHNIIWSKRGRLYSDKGNRLINEALYSLEPFKINQAGKYLVSYQVFPNKHACKVNNLSLSLKKDIIAVPIFAINILLVLIVIGIVLLFLSFKKHA